MTYLELVNAVLVRLREDTVSNVTEEPLIAALVNDAKRIVEDAWQWSMLRDTIEVITGSGIQTYSLTGVASRATIESVSIQSENLFLKQYSKKWLIERSFDTTMNATPSAWVADGADSNGDAQISFWPTPNSNYTVQVESFVRQADLSLDSDVLKVPHYPVYMLAWDMAARERGEVGGQSSAEIFALAQTALTDAIGHDFSKYDPQLDWYV